MDVVAALSAALAVLLLVWPYCQLRALDPALRRAVRLRQRRQGRRQAWGETFGPYLGLASAEQLCQYAGRPYRLTGVGLIQAQALCALLTAVVLGIASPWLGIVGGTIGWFVPRVLVSSIAQQRRARIALELPAFLDLWGLLVSSGEGVETALLEICRRHPEWLLSVESRRVLERISASGLFGESLLDEARVTGSVELITVAEQVSHLAEGGGVPSRELARMAEQMREQRVAELMQSAGAMAVVGIFPKMLSIFISLTPVIATIVLSVLKQVQ